MAQAKAQATRAQDIFAKTSIVSPIGGVVSRLQVREGEMVVIGIQNQPGTTLMTISDLSGINAAIKVASRTCCGSGSASRRGSLWTMPDRPFDGHVIEIGASALASVGNVAAAAREFRVVIRLDTPDPYLRPGLTCDAEILTGEKQGIMTVPVQAVVIRSRAGSSGPQPTGANGTLSADTRGVFVIEGETAQFKPVKTGIIGGLDIEIEGLDERTPPVVGPCQVLRELQDGAKIRTK